MPVEVTRFGAGHRRPQGPEGSAGVEGITIHGDARGTITELAFARGARLEPHQSPDSAWLCVVEGGGWVLVGAEQRPVVAGDAVAWPAGLLRAAWTDHIPMRALLVELSGPDDTELLGILEGHARLAASSRRRLVERGEGSLAPRDPAAGPEGREGEPL